MNNLLLEKYGSFTYNEETGEIKHPDGTTVIPSGKITDKEVGKAAVRLYNSLFCEGIKAVLIHQDEQQTSISQEGIR